MATEVMPAVGMSLELTEEQRFIQQTARKFAQDKIAKIAAEFDESGEFPFDTIKEMGKLGLMGIEVPEEYGGAGLDTIAYVLAEEEISKADASHGTIMSVNNSLFCNGILQYGTEEQKKKYVTAIASGKEIGAYSLTEPMSGSDARTMKSRAVLNDKKTHYSINGRKSWVTSACSPSKLRRISQGMVARYTRTLAGRGIMGAVRAGRRARCAAWPHRRRR